MDIAYIISGKRYAERKEQEYRLRVTLKEKRALMRCLGHLDSKDEKVAKLAVETKEAIKTAKKGMPRGNLQYFVVVALLVAVYTFAVNAAVKGIWEGVSPRVEGWYIQQFRSHSIAPAKLGYLLSRDTLLSLSLPVAYLLLMFLLQKNLRMSLAKWSMIAMFLVYALFWFHLFSAAMHLSMLPLVPMGA